MNQRFVLAATLAVVLSHSAHAQRPTPPQGPLVSGYLCCNMHTYGKSISDSNYDESGTRLLAVGTPARITGYEMRYIDTDIGGQPQRIKNDYSRDIAPIAFGQRYIVAADPKAKIATFAPPIRDAILAGKVAKGMTREQVLMAVSYPITSENPSLDAKVWRYWLDSFTEYRVLFDDAGLVRMVSATPETLERVLFSATAP